MSSCCCCNSTDRPPGGGLRKRLYRRASARLGGYALTSINVLILDIFPQIQLKTYNVCFKWTYAASHQTGETNLTIDILAIESKHRMLDPQVDNCRLTPFPRTVDIWHPINSHLYALAIRNLLKTSCFYWITLRSDRTKLVLAYYIFASRIMSPTLLHAESYWPTLYSISVAHSFGTEPLARTAYWTVYHYLKRAHYFTRFLL